MLRLTNLTQIKQNTNDFKVCDILNIKTESCVRCEKILLYMLYK